MMRGGGNGPFGLASCVATTDAVLQALAAVKAPGELATLMHDVTCEMGFRHYALIHHDELRGAPAHRVKLIDYPSAVEERIILQGHWRRDPVIRACLYAPAAFRWSDLPGIITMDRRDRRCLEEGASCGLNEGITVPFWLLRDCAGSCTFAGTRREADAERHLGMAQIVGVFAFQAARRVMLGTLPLKAAGPRLHPRCRDCVILAGRGFSNKKIARALGLTPRTVDGYMTEARQLFAARTRTELVISAVFAGEIGLHELARGQPE